jgi:peptide-methionine (S)-S-oxide reductase
MNKSLILGAGCFWGVEKLFEELNGVTKVTSGYCGGETKNPTYEQICTGTTGHVEVVEIHYDNSIINFSELLDKFFFIHDPTTINRQGPDIGTQYKSIIFFNSEDEKKLSEQKIEEIDSSKEHVNPIITELREAVEFYPAEEYHQDYIKKNGRVCYHQLYVDNK